MGEQKTNTKKSSPKLPAHKSLQRPASTDSCSEVNTEGRHQALGRAVEQWPRSLDAGPGLREFLERRGSIVSTEYLDSGVGGARESRPELNRLMADAHSRQFDAVVVWKFDRFAWSVSHLLRALETFKALGIEVVSLPEQIDTSTPMGKWCSQILGSVAEMERSHLYRIRRESIRLPLKNVEGETIKRDASGRWYAIA